MMRLPLLAALGLLLATGCREGSPLEEKEKNPVALAEERFGKGYLNAINLSDLLTIGKVQPDGFGGFTLEEKEVALSAKDLAALKELLLNDDSYLFDIEKRCLFVPEYLLRFKRGEKATLLLFSPLCKQLKMPYANFKQLIIDIDPSFERIEGIVKKYKPQLEDSDEK